MKNFFICFILFLSCLGCGKYAPPIPPEKLAPKPVSNIEAVTYERGVALTWVGSTKDIRSKELKSMDGYYVERGCVEGEDEYNGTANDMAQVEFEILSIVNDNQIETREYLRKEALKKGLSARRVKVPQEKLKFNYLDETIINGNTCFYKITPFNQDNVRGEASNLIKVRFIGEKSSVIILRGKKARSNAVMYEN